MGLTIPAGMKHEEKDALTDGRCLRAVFQLASHRASSFYWRLAHHFVLLEPSICTQRKKCVWDGFEHLLLLSTLAGLN